MSENYAVLNMKEFNKGTKEDPISLDDLLPVAENGRRTIGYLRLLENKPRVIVYYDTLSAYNTFVTNKVLLEPETRAPLNKGFVDRITLYYQAITTLTEEQLALSIIHEDPVQQRAVNQQKCVLFQRYLYGQATPTEYRSQIQHLAAKRRTASAVVIRAIKRPAYAFTGVAMHTRTAQRPKTGFLASTMR
jgi:hypothetical protein